MKDGIISAKQANDILENSRKKQYEQLLTEIQEKLDDALKYEQEFFRVRIPVWCQKDMVAYLRQMGYEVVSYEGEEYSVVFGKRMLKELDESVRKRKLKKYAKIIAILMFLAVLYWAVETFGCIVFIYLLFALLAWCGISSA